MSSCFISGETDCKLTVITYNGVDYNIKEELSEEYSFKKLKEMIDDKIEKEKEKKLEAISSLKEICKTLDVPLDKLGKFLLGEDHKEDKKPEVANEDVKPKDIKTNKVNKDDGFKVVDGSLITKVGVKVNTSEGVSGSLPAYSGVRDENDKQVIEEDKRVKRIDDNTIVERSKNMGTTTIKINQQNSREIEKMLREVDDENNLVRGAVAGGSGGRTIECSLCRGTGITRTGHKICVKCGGTGFINL